MKVITAGRWLLTFSVRVTCPRCATVLEVGKPDITKQDNYYYTYRCPTCHGEQMIQPPDDWT